MTAFHYLKAVIFDWAGTMIDFGSRAPMGAFVEAFSRFQVALTIEEARGPMGLPKRAHIAKLFSLPHVARAWEQAQGTPADDNAIDRLFEVFVPLNAEVVGDYAEMIPGAVAMAQSLRQRGLKIGSTTGYTRPIMERLLPLAKAQGYAPDNLVCAGDLSDGRPTPLMMYRCFADLGVYPPDCVVKVDDTAPGIAEAVAAGSWAVGVAVSGNAFGLSLNETEILSRDDPHTFAARRAKAARELSTAGAYKVIDSVAELMPVLNEIESRLAEGERP